MIAFEEAGMAVSRSQKIIPYVGHVVGVLLPGVLVSAEMVELHHTLEFVDSAFIVPQNNKTRLDNFAPPLMY